MNFSNSMYLIDVFVIPDFHVNLLSVYKLCNENNCEVIFDENHCTVQDSLSMETGKEFGDLYYLEIQSLGRSNFVNNNSKFFISKITWHNRVGHPIDQALNVLTSVLNFDNESVMTCEVCYKAKQTRESFPLSEYKSCILGDLIHLDVWGP